MAVGRHVVADERRETVVAVRWVGFTGFRRSRALEGQVGYWICCHAGHWRPFANEAGQRSARTGPPQGSKKYIAISNGYLITGQVPEPLGRRLLCPAARIAVVGEQNGRA